MVSGCCSELPVDNTLRMDAGACSSGSCGNDMGLCSKCNKWSRFHLEFWIEEKIKGEHNEE